MSLGRMEAKIPAGGEPRSIIQNVSADSMLDASVRAQIGQRLRSLYAIVTDPLPERFQDLLRQLDTKPQARF